MIQHYQQCVDKYAAEVAALKRKNNGFITGELLSFGALLAFVVCFFALDGDARHWLLGALLALVAYSGIRRLDDKNKERIARLSALLAVCQNEVKALQGDFTPFETGEQYQNPQHPYSFDLDVFGRDSLFNRICRTITSGGSDRLAESLSRNEPLQQAEIARRTALQRELAEEGEVWRMEFMALGERNKNQVLDGPDSSPGYSKLHNLHMDMAAAPVRQVVGYRKIDSAAVAEAMVKVSAMDVPAWYGSQTSLVVGWMLIVGVVSSVVLSFLDVLPVNIAAGWVMAQFMVVFAVCKQTLDKIDSNGGKLRRQLVAYSQILQLIARRNFHSEMGKRMQADLSEALPSFARLEKILKSYDRRGNFLALFFTDAFMLSDFFLVRSFLKWKNTYMVKMEEWMDIVGEMDAAVSMADFRYNHPEATDAEFVEGEPVVFDAHNLYHPFLGAKAVKNDFSVIDGNYYIVTGANMAGKSTFLRSLGVNYILSMAGMPVFADSLRLSRFRLFSSMRTSDDLTHGISYFNAELLRLEQLMQFCKESPSLRTLIILDEILKGTNSADKLNGSRLFLEAISRLPVSGVIATHDLELSKMEQEHGDGAAPGDPMRQRFHNYCFEIDLGTDVTYTYKIQQGVARNQNATFLLTHLIERNLGGKKM